MQKLPFIWDICVLSSRGVCNRLNIVLPTSAGFSGSLELRLLAHSTMSVRGDETDVPLQQMVNLVRMLEAG
jgi:hypothetical protein